MKKRLFLKIFGEVQGVFYRVEAKKVARQLDLNGWVKNEPDGSVAICAEGEESQLKKLLDWCQFKSPGKTLHIDESWEQNLNEFKQFNINY